MGWCCINYLPLVEPPTSSSDMRHVFFSKFSRSPVYPKKTGNVFFKMVPFQGDIRSKKFEMKGSLFFEKNLPGNARTIPPLYKVSNSIPTGRCW